MAVFHQMGHDSRNLVSETNLSEYSGAILSPVNYREDEVIDLINDTRDNLENFKFIFDPQLYYPHSEREKLLSWDYFPSDTDTADLSSHPWWDILLEKISKTCNRLSVNAVCSPVIFPSLFSSSYYDSLIEVGNRFVTTYRDIQVIQTILISMPELAVFANVMEYASIITKSVANSIYLIFYNNLEPRRELKNADELKGAMRLISILEENDFEVIVGYCSSDMMLWKTAGAAHCASGKFFNLRRFTLNRWEEPGGGGGQLPYLFEEKLNTFLRETDFTRVNKIDLISDVTKNNPYFPDIVSAISKGDPWLGLSWRLYLYWFYNLENRISNNSVNVKNFLIEADFNWSLIDSNDVFMEERGNDGSWIRQWLRAVVEYDNPW